MYRAALDTSVLVPSLTRDFLLQLATERCYQAIWGRAVVVELDYVLERLDEKSGRRTAEESRAYRARLLDRMEAAFPGSCVEAATKGDSPDYGLVDPDDNHLVHAAILGKADAIVTNDRRAGLAGCRALRAADVEILSAAEFMTNTYAQHPIGAAAAAERVARRRGLSVDEVLRRLDLEPSTNS